MTKRWRCSYWLAIKNEIRIPINRWQQFSKNIFKPIPERVFGERKFYKEIKMNVNLKMFEKLCVFVISIRLFLDNLDFT